MPVFACRRVDGGAVLVGSKGRRAAADPGEDASLRERNDIWREWFTVGRYCPETKRRERYSQGRLARIWGVSRETVVRGIAAANAIRKALHDAHLDSDAA
jgi:hypothetical protein